MASNSDKDKDQKQTGSGSSRGFASMDEDKQREIASKGGKASHEKGTAHEFTSEEARVRQGRPLMKKELRTSSTSEEAREAGRKGGESSHGGHGQGGSHGSASSSSTRGGGMSEQHQGWQPKPQE